MKAEVLCAFQLCLECVRLMLGTFSDLISLDVDSVGQPVFQALAQTLIEHHVN